MLRLEKKNEGGLSVRVLKKFNNLLLGKWHWRLLFEKESLWGKKILCVRYGEVDAYELR